jgi:hypothetical protein
MEILHILLNMFVFVGTGKTITAIKIAYWFAHLNTQASVSGEKKQVMYCGPSNSAVDVAMGKYYVKSCSYLTILGLINQSISFLFIVKKMLQQLLCLIIN